MSAENELLQLACEQARSAGALLLERFQSGQQDNVRTKTTPTDLVSDADLQAERLIREGIARARPRDALLGEEGEDTPGRSGLRWVVDPLDGTVNFIFSIPHWAVSLAVQNCDLTPSQTLAVQDGEGALSQMLAGAVFDPLRDELFTATSTGEPQLGGRPISASRCADLATAMVATGFNYDATVRAAQAQAIERLIPRVRDIRRFGAASLDLVWTAAGRCDAYFERGLHLWDVAAGVLICERAGLQVRELAERENLPWGVLVAPAGLLEELMELVG